MALSPGRRGISEQWKPMGKEQRRIHLLCTLTPTAESVKYVRIMLVRSLKWVDKRREQTLSKVQDHWPALEIASGEQCTSGMQSIAGAAVWMTKSTEPVYQYGAWVWVLNRNDICVPHCSDPGFRWVTEKVAVECRMYSTVHSSTYIGLSGSLESSRERSPWPAPPRQELSKTAQSHVYRELNLMSL